MPGQMPRYYAKTRARLALIQEIIRESAPITVRGVAYKMLGISGGFKTMKEGYNIVQEITLKARRYGDIAWADIVDNSRPVFNPSVYDSAEGFLDDVMGYWQLDPWATQERRVEVLSEKATIHGVIESVLDDYAVPFRSLTGFGSDTALRRLLHSSGAVALYVGDRDPSGMWMSEEDLPNRFGMHGIDVALRRIAVLPEHVEEFKARGIEPLKPNSQDGRTKWFKQTFGDECWELDALDPKRLREILREAIEDYIEVEAWRESAERSADLRDQLRGFFDTWEES